MKTRLDKGLCIGCELCTDIAPRIYRMDSDGKAMALKSELDADDGELAAEAADGCPTDAISLS